MYNLLVETIIENAHLREKILWAEKQMILADRFTSLGKIAAGLAHEIKNPLSVIKGMAQALEKNPQDTETLADFLAVVPREIDRLHHLVDQLARIGRTTKPQLEPVDLNALIENTLLLFKNRCCKQNIKIIRDFHLLPPLSASPLELTQAFINLILNAIQAMPGGGELKLKTDYSQLTTNNKTSLEISDSGYGIPEDKLHEIFEPFYTTKEEGSGLGLAITRKIIEEYGGKIKVESKLGKGTVFKIIFTQEVIDPPGVA